MKLDLEASCQRGGRITVRSLLMATITSTEEETSRKDPWETCGDSAFRALLSLLKILSTVWPGSPSLLEETSQERFRITSHVFLAQALSVTEEFPTPANSTNLTQPSAYGPS